MNRILLTLFALAAFVTRGAAQETTVTFDFTDPSVYNSAWAIPAESAAVNIGDDDKLAKDGVEIGFKKVAQTDNRFWRAKGSEVCDLRVYKESQMTIYAPEGKKVRKVEFAGSGSKTASVTVGEFTASTSTWVGNEANVEFTATGTLNLTTCAVTYDDGTGEITPPEEPESPAYTTIAELKENATTTATATSYKFENLLVNAVAKSGKNYSVFCTDGTAGILFYGPNVPAAEAGDLISGTLSGELVLYNNQTEIQNADYSNVTVAGKGTVTPTNVEAIAQLLDQNKPYENMLVRLANVVPGADKLDSNKSIALTDDDDNTINLRDNFGFFATYTFKAGEPYNITAVLVPYKDQFQLVPVSEDGVEYITTKVQPEGAWNKETIILQPSDEWKATATFTTTSDGAVTYTSSNPEVATIDEQGNITVKGFGKAKIQALSAETDNYLEGQDWLTLYVLQGYGTLEAPYGLGDVDYYVNYEYVQNPPTTKSKVWVKGNIYGYMKNNAIFTDLTTPEMSNLVIATSEENAVPVQLPAGKVRDMLNLKDNAELQGKDVWLHGTMELYFNLPGVKNVDDYSLTGEFPVLGITSVQGESAKQTIYSLDGRRLSPDAKGLRVVNGKLAF